MRLKPATIVVLVLSLMGYVFAGYFLKRENFYFFLGVYVLLFGCYWYLLRVFSKIDQISLQDEKPVANRFSPLDILLVASVIYRLTFLFSVPTLSDDFYRFIWDGTMFAQGENPYTVLPSFQILFSDEQDPYLLHLFSGMNSQDYYSIYPPVSQFIFLFAAKLFPGNLTGAVMVLRAVIIAAEIGTLIFLGKILEQLRVSQDKILVYALNPLVIIELSGNLHFEGVMIFFLLSALWFLLKGKISLSAVLYSCSVAVKLIPLLFLPLMIRRLKGWSLLWFYALTGITFFLLFVPFLNQDLFQNFFSSIDLYFQRFEFNASVYYLSRWVGFQFTGYNMIQKIGPALAAVVFLLAVLVVFREKYLNWKNWFLSAQWMLTIYLLLAATVHPWYLATLIVFSVFTGYWYPIVWSGMVVLSYATYRQQPFHENLLFTSTEYFVVLSAMIYEIYLHLKKAIPLLILENEERK